MEAAPRGQSRSHGDNFARPQAPRWNRVFSPQTTRRSLYLRNRFSGLVQIRIAGARFRRAATDRFSKLLCAGRPRLAALHRSSESARSSQGSSQFNSRGTRRRTPWPPAISARDSQRRRRRRDPRAIRARSAGILRAQSRRRMAFEMLAGRLATANCIAGSPIATDGAAS